uniref:Uncharacterized protein n=1 Tax=Populus alba TaxID=43335 RepID=A0A4U5P7G9_POPAL|nr:hypothetical protein D5086_0000219730 [Populus alba]
MEGGREGSIGGGGCRSVDGAAAGRRWRNGWRRGACLAVWLSWVLQSWGDRVCGAAVVGFSGGRSCRWSVGRRKMGKRAGAAVGYGEAELRETVLGMEVWWRWGLRVAEEKVEREDLWRGS